VKKPRLSALHGCNLLVIVWSVMCSFIFAGCSSLPPAETAVARPSTEETVPTIVESQGVLSAKKTKAIIRRLEKAAGPTDMLKRQTIVMEEISGSPLVAGNKVTLLLDGPATYAAMYKAIEAAHDNINLETFTFAADKVGRGFADLLLQKQAEGVQVNLIYDSVGCLSTPAAFFKRLRAGGVHTLEVNPLDPLKARGDLLLTDRDHRKILVVDGEVAFTGGVNISGVYSQGYSEGSQGEEWRDTHVQIEGPAVAEFQKLFLDMWKRQKGSPLASKNYFPPLQPAGSNLVEVVGSAPGVNNRLTYLMYLSAILFAGRSVYLTSAYFAPDDQMKAALEHAARRGVDVELVLPSVSDQTLVLYAGRSYYEDLLEAGVKIYERRDAILHAKTAAIDDVWSTVGSTNMDLWSFARNYEVNAIVVGTGFADQLKALFAADVKASNRITPEEWSRRSFSERLREWFARLARYWL
jgi:cardiolipin synthase